MPQDDYSHFVSPFSPSVFMSALSYGLKNSSNHLMLIYIGCQSVHVESICLILESGIMFVFVIYTRSQHSDHTVTRHSQSSSSSDFNTLLIAPQKCDVYHLMFSSCLFVLVIELTTTSAISPRTHSATLRKFFHGLPTASAMRSHNIIA